MRATRALMALVLVCSVLAYGCSALVAAYLINELLDDKAPKRTWSGHVRDTAGQPVAGVEVSVRGTVETDTNVATFKDITDTAGFYSIRFRYNKDVSYAVRVEAGGVVLAEVDYGTIENSDRTSDLVIQGAVNVELSGVVQGPDGLPLKDVVVVGASASALDGTPVALLADGSKVQYDVTSDAGVFSLNGSISKYGIVCAFHPDHGFAYAYGEDTDGNGSIALTIVMGTKGEYDLRAQVIDANNNPLAPQILQPSRQFRLRLQTPFNLSPTMDIAVSENGLFPGLLGDPSDFHPPAMTLTVQAVGASGYSSNSMQVAGGTYQVSLLNVGDDEPATALIKSANPLALYQDTSVTVQVN